MSSISALSLRILVRSTTRIGLDFPQSTLIGIAGKMKKLLTCTQDTTRAKLERLYSAGLIYGDQTTTARHAIDLIKINELISLLISTIKHIN
jgi:uncharacterized protein YciW